MSPFRGTLPHACGAEGAPPVLSDATCPPMAQAAVLFVYVTWAITAWFVFVYGALRLPAKALLAAPAHTQNHVCLITWQRLFFESAYFSYAHAGGPLCTTIPQRGSSPAVPRAGPHAMHLARVVAPRDAHLTHFGAHSYCRQDGV
jgi:hypothetical protein